MGVSSDLLSLETIERRMHAFNLLITGLEGQYTRLRREYFSLHSDVDFPESCADDLEFCNGEFGSRCGFFRTVPGLGNVVEANRLREDARNVMNLMILHRYLDAHDVLSLIEASISEYRSLLASLRAAVTRLSRALRIQWHTFQLRDLRKITSDFEKWFEVLHSRYAALPSMAFDDELLGMSCQTLELDEEFGEGFLERGDLATQLASLRNVASQLEMAIDVRRHPGEWAEELLQEGLMTLNKVGRRLGELEETVTAYDEAFGRPHLVSERTDASPGLGESSLKVKILQLHQPSILERYATLPTEEKETNDQAAPDSSKASGAQRQPD